MHWIQLHYGASQRKVSVDIYLFARPWTPQNFWMEHLVEKQRQQSTNGCNNRYKIQQQLYKSESKDIGHLVLMNVTTCRCQTSAQNRPKYAYVSCQIWCIFFTLRTFWITCSLKNTSRAKIRLIWSTGWPSCFCFLSRLKT
jgi:hypothetical protein